jgi:hypothetical protein
MGTLHPFPGNDINPVGKTLDEFRAVVIKLQQTEPIRMAGDLDTIASGLLALHMLVDRIVAARVEHRIDAAE